MVNGPHPRVLCPKTVARLSVRIIDKDIEEGDLAQGLTVLALKSGVVALGIWCDVELE